MRTCRFVFLAALSAAHLAVMAAGAADLRGNVELVNEKGQRATGARQTVIYFTPAQGAKAPTPPAEPFSIATVRKDFQPHVLPVPKGSRVAFPNEDVIIHNVFSVSGGNKFDLGLYRPGQSKEATFNEAGVARIFCNVHHSMAAYVVVLDTPYYTQADANGDFVLAGVPDGPGTLTIWHERRGEPVTMEVTVPAAPVQARLELNRERVPKHKNKFGKRYSRSRRDTDYR